MEETQFYKLIEEKIKKSVERFSDVEENNRRNLNDPRLQKVRELIKKYSWFYRNDISSKFEYIVEDEKTGDILKYNLKTREVLLEIPSTGKHLFFNPRTKLWEEYTPEENKHFNLKTGKWEYYNDATGEWTSLTSAKETDKSEEDIKMIYDKTNKTFVYITKDGMAIYSPEKQIWGINKENTRYFSALDGKEVQLDIEKGIFVHKDEEIKTDKPEKSVDYEENDADLERLLNQYNLSPEQKTPESEQDDDFSVKIPNSEQNQSKSKTFSFKAIWNKVTDWFRGGKPKVAGYLEEARKQAEKGIKETQANINNGVNEAKEQLNKGVNIAKEKVASAKEGLSTAQQRLGDNFKLLLNNDVSDKQRNVYRAQKSERNVYRAQKATKPEIEEIPERYVYRASKDANRQVDSLANNERYVYRKRQVYRSEERQKQFEEQQNKKAERKLKLAEYKSGLKFKDTKRSIASLALVGVMFAGVLAYVNTNSHNIDHNQPNPTPISDVSTQIDDTADSTFKGVGRDYFENVNDVVDSEQNEQKQDEENVDKEKDNNYYNTHSYYQTTDDLEITSIANGDGNKGVAKSGIYQIYNIAIVKDNKILYTTNCGDLDTSNDEVKKLLEDGGTIMLALKVPGRDMAIGWTQAENASQMENKDVSHDDTER